MIVHQLPEGVGFIDALKVSGATGKLNVITTGVSNGSFDWKDRYNIWSGVIGGFFLALSYFGTDQSQVGRYLTAKNNTESKIGLLMNGLVKVPMQFFILLIGALLFTFYQFKPSPVFHNRLVEQQAYKTVFKDSLQAIKQDYDVLNKQQNRLSMQFVNDAQTQPSTANSLLKDSLLKGDQQMQVLRNDYKGYLKKAVPLADNNDTNYIFLRFVVDYLPVGLIGLLIAIIFLAAWGSIAAALNSLASCTMIDFHQRFRKNATDEHVDECNAREYVTSRWYTFGWGIFCIFVAQFANRMGSLIEAVNILGSLFYGVILGIFLVAFYIKKIGGKAVFWSAVVSEISVVTLFFLNQNGIIGLSFLWLNVVGAGLVVIISAILQGFSAKKVVLV